MTDLQDAIHADLASPRTLPTQVAVHLGSHHEVEADHIVAFFKNDFPDLEDYQVDLILSPAFTPGLQEQSRYSRFVENAPLTDSDVDALILGLARRPTRSHFVVSSGGEFEVQLREVTLDRYVRRLHLNQPVEQPVAACIRHWVPAEDRSRLHAIARRPVWRPAPRATMLLDALSKSLLAESYRVADFELLLRLVEQYLPAHGPELSELIPELVRGVETELVQRSVPKPFFSERIREMHGGSRDQRAVVHDLRTDKRAMLDGLSRLAALLHSPKPA